MLLKVKVAPDFFKDPMFMGATVKKEFVRGERVPDSQKKQAYTNDGVPKWSVRVGVVVPSAREEDRDQTISVTVASREDPNAVFSRGELVHLTGLFYGVSPTKNNGFSVWWSADGIASAAATATA